MICLSRTLRMSSQPNHHTKKGPSSGNPEKSASTGSGNVRRPPPAAAEGGAKSSSTGDEKTCSHGNKCENAHCRNQHPKEWVRPERCMFGKSCTSFGRDKCPLPSANCDNYQNCSDPKCDKKHDKRRKLPVSAPVSVSAPESVPVPAPESVPVHLDLGMDQFPSLSGNVVETQYLPIKTGTDWATMVGGGGESTEKPDFSQQISAIVASVPVIFESAKFDLKQRLMVCLTPQELLSLLKGMSDEFAEYLKFAVLELGNKNSDVLISHSLELLITIFGENLEIPTDFQENILKYIEILLTFEQSFSNVYKEVLPSLTHLSETLESSNCVSSTALIQSVSQVHHAIRKLQLIQKQIGDTDVLQSGVLTNMIQMLSSVASSNISSTSWCLELLIESMLASANNLLKEVMTADEKKKLKEQERLYQLLLNPKCESSGTAEHLMACLLALSFHTKNATVYGMFVSSLSREEQTCLERNLDKYFECLVSQIFKSLLSKAEMTNNCFRDSNERYLMGLLNLAFESLNNMIQSDSNEIRKFLQTFSKEQGTDPIFPPAFVIFMYTTYIFKGNEGANPMVKLLAWYASVLKAFFNLEIICDNFRVMFFVLNDHVDERGDTHKEKVDITGTVMHFLFEMVCFAEVFRRNGKDFPYGNISNRLSLAIKLNKTGKDIDPGFVGYSKLTDTEQSACPYNPSFKKISGCESNSDVVQLFFQRTVKLQNERLDESFVQQLNEIKRSFLPDSKKINMFFDYVALFCVKDRAEISMILRGMQIIMSKDAEDPKNKENRLKSLLKGDFSCLHEPIFETSRYFLKSGSKNEVDEVVQTFLEGINEVVDMVLSSGITSEDITSVHCTMRNFYMANRRELYLHPCLIAIILALTQRYKVSFQDVYNMVRSALKNNRWKAFTSFSEKDPIQKSMSDLQPQTSEFSFLRAFEFSQNREKNKIVLSASQNFWCRVNLFNVPSKESIEVLDKIQSLINDVVSLIILHEAFAKNVLMQPSSIIDLLNNVITFRLMGPNFKHLMKLFGITDLTIKDMSSEQPPSSNMLNAFSSGVGFQTMETVSQSMFNHMLFDHRKEYPAFMQLPKAERKTALESIRNNVQKTLVEKFLRFGLGLTVDLTDLPVINSFVVFDIVRKKMSLFDLPFFKKLIRVINDGLYANSFHSIQAKKARFSANKLFLKSQSGDAVGAMTFSDAIHEVPDDSDDRFQNPDEVIRALEELFSDGKKKSGFSVPLSLKGVDIGSKLQNFPPSIMACQKLIPLFPPPTEGEYTEFPKEHDHIFSRVFGITMSVECGGIEFFNEMYLLSPDALVSQYANLVSLGNEDLEANVLSSEFYARFLYLLQGLQYFSSIDVEEMVKEALAQREQSDK